jgi:hypothetical protein
MLRGVSNILTRVQIPTCSDPIPDDQLDNSKKTRLRYSRALMVFGLLHRPAL